MDSSGAHIHSIIYRVLYRESVGGMRAPLAPLLSTSVYVSIRQRQHTWMAEVRIYRVLYIEYYIERVEVVLPPLSVYDSLNMSAYVSISIRQHRWHPCCSRYSVSYCLHSLYDTLDVCPHTNP